MEIKPREIVIFAENFKDMVEWYKNILDFKVVRIFDEGYHYANLETESGLKIGITPAAEVGVEPGERKNNPVIMHIVVDDVPQFFEYLKKNDVKINFGPSFEKGADFYYGSFSDLEGNPIWVVDNNCP